MRTLRKTGLQRVMGVWVHSPAGVGQIIDAQVVGGITYLLLALLEGGTATVPGEDCEVEIIPRPA